MIPNVFVSSTIDDLHHLRDAIRDTLREDLAYAPVMSEYGDIGYLPNISVQDSCYVSLKHCQVVIIIIGKRYGSVSPNGFSVTHNEFREARVAGIPTIAFVDHEVLAFRKVSDAQRDGTSPLSFPGMDAPEKSFAFIKEIVDAGTNNAIISFGKVSEARELLKKQLASMFGALLSSRHSPFATEVKDILSEVISLRHELSRNHSFDRRLVSAIRFLVDDEHSFYRHFIEHTVGPIDTTVDALLKSKTFEEFIKLSSVAVSDIPEDKDSHEELLTVMKAGDMTFASERLFGPPREPGEAPCIARYMCFRGNRARMNRVARERLSWFHEQFRLAVGREAEPNPSSNATPPVR